MTFVEVRRCVSFECTSAEGTEYRRYDRNVWEELMGMSWEPTHNYDGLEDKLEAAFQTWRAARDEDIRMAGDR